MSQTFKWPFPHKLLYGFLDKICIFKDGVYMVNTEAYKKGMYYDYITEFVNESKQYYFLSKRKYLERKMTYASLLTILRQICKHHDIPYTTQIKYCGATYDIHYFITKVEYDSDADSVNNVVT